MPNSTEPINKRGLRRSPITTLLATTVLSCGSSRVTSSTFLADGYRTGIAFLRVSDTGSTQAPSIVSIRPQFSSDSGVNYHNYLEDIWSDAEFSAVSLQSSTRSVAWVVPLTGRRMRFLVERESTLDTGENYSVGIDLEARNR